jgi:hypothetical protein
MTLRGLIIAVAVCFPAAIFVSSGWGRSQPPRQNPGYTDYGSSYYDTSTPLREDYNEGIKKSLERLTSETERLAIGQILAELDKKSYREILALKLAPDVCQELACRAVSSTTVRHYVDAFDSMRVADDAHEAALRSSAASEWSTLIAAASASVSLLSLLISALSYRRTVRSAKSAIPA